MKALMAAAAALCLLPAAALGCNHNLIAGTYEVQVTRFDHQYAMTTWGTCWFEVTRARPEVANLRISCAAGEPTWHGYFGLGEAYGQPDDPLYRAPWHQLHKVTRPAPDGVRSINACRWRLIDRNGVEGIEYNVTFGTDGGGLQGITTAYHWLARGDVTFVLTGVRQ